MPEVPKLDLNELKIVPNFDDNTNKLYILKEQILIIPKSQVNE